eukprot:TRINITY_DN8662_c0_g1_i1.p1 TRINITY_DN8662_c0_g1~~TRINITY_DN8662_c0_g1_i1.p1  ORF type:complete len:368 (+),score=19.79 TRINITY_DN8662_c0_g1_i1:32-1135(+)
MAQSKSIDIEKLYGYLKKRLFGDEDDVPTPQFVAQGFCKGFLLWFIPIVLFRRSTQGLTRALALGTFAAVVRAQLRLKDKWAKPGTLLEKYSYAIMGFNGGATFLLLDRDIHKNSVLVFWILVRSLYNALPSIGPYGPAICMCLSASQLLGSWIKAPQELDQNYLGFLDWQSGVMRPDRIWAAKQTVPPVRRPCFLVHPNQSCETHFVYFFIDGLFRAMRLYFPLHLMLTLMSKDKSIPQFLENLLRSCVFLAGYCSMAWYSACTVHRVLPIGVSRLSLMLHTWVAGLFILCERPRRQVELAMYCSTYALDSVYKFIRTTELGKTFSLPRRLIMLCSLSILSHYHMHQPHFVTRWLCGIPTQEVEEK